MRSPAGDSRRLAHVGCNEGLGLWLWQPKTCVLGIDVLYRETDADAGVRVRLKQLIHDEEVLSHHLSEGTEVHTHDDNGALAGDALAVLTELLNLLP